MPAQMIDVEYTDLAPFSAFHAVDGHYPPRDLGLPLGRGPGERLEGGAGEVGERGPGFVDGDMVRREAGVECGSEEGCGDVAALITAFVGAWAGVASES